jgi:hypothetical protein
MADAATEDGDTDDPITYQFQMDREQWRKWTNTIPRNHPIDGRLQTLIEQDLRSAAREGDQDDPINEKTLNIFATRIRIRAMQALGAVRDDENPEQAIDQLEELIDIADVLES